MNYTLYGFLLAGSLFFGMLIVIEVGRRIGVRRRAEDPEGGRAGFGTIEAAVRCLPSWGCSSPSPSREPARDSMRGGI